MRSGSPHCASELHSLPLAVPRRIVHIEPPSERGERRQCRSHP